MDGLIEKVVAIVIVVVAVIAVGLFGMNFIRDGMETGNKAQGDLNKMNTAMMENEFTQYDATEVWGSNLINIIKNYENQKEQICIIVNNGRRETEYVRTSNLSQEASTKAKDAKQKSNLDLYINPSTKYLGEVIRDTDTGTITALKFTKVD